VPQGARASQTPRPLAHRAPPPQAGANQDTEPRPDRDRDAMPTAHRVASRGPVERGAAPREGSPSEALET
jgi:hypothetical protein